ncbi:MAG TPA: hypothetical protein VHB27_13095 [Rhodopila sp.]|uniref:hypothetical protein n=1 Tax=Rhodopila sp. TaxID=2480087 RepID=UPI002D188746|nr:hypothetical protein [Rhodopila sp.]HVY16154.1 hypothetical protein [Rhodopila sp.]
MIDIIALLEALFSLIRTIGRLSGRKLSQPMLTAICLTFAYTAVHVGQEGSFLAGVRTAFLDNETARQDHRRIEEQATLQQELRQFVASNKVINQILESIMLHAPGASRASLSVIHNGVTGMTGSGLLRYDDTNSVAAPGRMPALVVTNQPLSDWSDLLPNLLTGDCTFRRTIDLRSSALRTRFDTYGVTSVLVCPAADVQNRIVGAIFVTWDAHDDVPDAEQVRSLMEAGHHQGAQIAAVLDLRGPSPLIPTGEGN